LPALTGSEKQVNWATTIRSGKLEEARQRLANGRESAKRAVASGTRTRTEVNQVLKRGRAAYNNLAKHKSASYWIDSRSSNGGLLLQIEMNKLK
jgi:hypothetical protein